MSFDLGLNALQVECLRLSVVLAWLGLEAPDSRTAGQPDGRTHLEHRLSVTLELQGVDFPDVSIVCNAGLPSDIVEALQRGGRVGRHEGAKALFVTFYEAWACKISLNEFMAGDPNDPDGPRSNHTLISRAQDRASYSSVGLVQIKTCLRQYFAQMVRCHLSSKLYTLIISALDYTDEFCCDRHQDDVFDLNDHLPALTYEPVNTTVMKRKARPIYRPKVDRLPLDSRIIAWLKSSSENDPLCGVRTMDGILSFRQRVKLVRATPDPVHSAGIIVNLLEETEEWGSEWGGSLAELISAYDRERVSLVSGRSKLMPRKKVQIGENCYLILG